MLIYSDGVEGHQGKFGWSQQESEQLESRRPMYCQLDRSSVLQHIIIWWLSSCSRIVWFNLSDSCLYLVASVTEWRYPLSFGFLVSFFPPFVERFYFHLLSSKRVFAVYYLRDAVVVLLAFYYGRSHGTWVIQLWTSKTYLNEIKKKAVNFFFLLFGKSITSHLRFTELSSAECLALHEKYVLLSLKTC